MWDNSNTYHFYGPEDIRRYLNGDMNAQEMHDMEKAALKDPLLADAIDGFRNTDPAVTDKHLNEIKAAILGSSFKENLVIPINEIPRNRWWRWAVAACTLGIVASATWWFTQKQEEGTHAPVAHIPAPATEITTTPVTEKDVSKTAAPVIQPETPLKNKLQAVTAPARNPSADVKKPAGITEKATAADHTAASPVAETKTAPAAFNNDAAQSAIAYQEASAPAIALERPVFSPRSSLLDRPLRFVSGKITDEAGNPIPDATVSASRDVRILSKKDGSFTLPATDSTLKVSVSYVGYENIMATLTPGKVNHVKLAKNEPALNEVVVVGYGRQKKKPMTKAIADYRKFQKQSEADWKNEILYPEEGWAHFYQELGADLGVDKSKATKTLQIKFTVDENGDPVDFEIVQSPDEVLAKKAIEFIKKAKWKNFKLDKNAIVKIEIN